MEAYTPLTRLSLFPQGTRFQLMKHVTRRLVGVTQSNGRLHGEELTGMAPDSLGESMSP